MVGGLQTGLVGGLQTGLGVSEKLVDRMLNKNRKQEVTTDADSIFPSLPKIQNIETEYL